MRGTLNTTFKSTCWDAFLAIGAGVASLALYIRTLAPGVLPGDSGEFQVLAYQLGIAHCPGYPIYLLMAKVFTFLPVGEISYRVNLFSAVMAAVAVSGVYMAARLLSANRWAALFGALALAVSFTFWSQAVIAEVYTAGAAFVATILVCVLWWQKTGKALPLFLAGLLGGLSLGIHTTVAVLAPGIVVFLWLHRKEHPVFWRAALGGAVVGILLWITTFVIIDWNYPPANIFNGAYETARSAWGLSLEDIHNPWARIWFVASAQQWRSALDFDLGRMLMEAGNYFSGLPREFSDLTILLIVLGMISLTWKRKDVASLFGLALIFHWLISFNYQIWDIYVFFIIGYVLLAILAAIGLDVFGQWIQKLSLKWGGGLLAVVSILFLLFAVGSVLTPRLPAVQRGEVPFIGEESYLLWEDPASMINGISHTVEKMKPNAIVFMDWNWLYTYYYIAHIEQGRTDLRFIEPSPRADVPGLPHSVIEFIDANIETRPIYFSRPFAEVEAAGFTFQRAEIWYTTFYKVVRP
jgi:hypothetical protein